MEFSGQKPLVGAQRVALSSWLPNKVCCQPDGSVGLQPEKTWKDYKTTERAGSRAPLFTAWLSHAQWKTSSWPERWLRLESLLNQHNPHLPANRKSSRADQVLLNLLERPAWKHRGQKPCFSAEEATALAALLHRELNPDLCAHILTGCCLIWSPRTLVPFSFFLFYTPKFSEGEVGTFGNWMHLQITTFKNQFSRGFLFYSKWIKTKAYT